jgi:hypothetical protein
MKPPRELRFGKGPSVSLTAPEEYYDFDVLKSGRQREVCNSVDFEQQLTERVVRKVGYTVYR